MSIVENPKPSKGKNYGKWQGDKKLPSNREQLEQFIDSALENCKSYEAFIAAMIAADCEVKRGKYLSIKIPGAERFARLKSLGENYSEEAIRERISGKRIVALKPKIAMPPPVRVPKLLIDIQEKLQQAHNPGFEHYAKIYNLKEMARTLIFLKEKGIGTYDELVKKSQTVTNDYNGNQTRINEINSRQKEIAELQRQIGTYSKTKDTYAHYKKLQKYELTTWEKFRKAEHPSITYYEAERTDIALHEMAKKYFDEHGFKGKKKLPTINSLKAEYAELESEKKKLNHGHKDNRDDMIALKTAKRNVDMFFTEPLEPQQRERKKTYDHSL